MCDCDCHTNPAVMHCVPCCDDDSWMTEPPPSVVRGMTTLENIIYDVRDEVETAMSRFPPFNSAHEGFAVIQEEFNKELWEHVCAKQGARQIEAMRKEAIQVAAMAIRFIHDVCDKGRGQK